MASATGRGPVTGIVKCLQHLQQRPALLPGQGVGLQLRGNPQPTPASPGPYCWGSSDSQHVFHVPVGSARRSSRRSRSSSFSSVQGRLQVDAQTVGVLVPIPQMGAGRQHQGPGHAEVGEQQLAKFPEYDLTFLVQRRQAPHFSGPDPASGRSRPSLAHQRAPGTRGAATTVWPSCRRHAVAVPGGAGAGIADAAGGQDHGLRPGSSPFSPATAVDRAALRHRRTPPGHGPSARLDAPAAASEAPDTSKAQSDAGKTRFPRSVFSGTPSSSKKAIVIPAPEAGKGTVKKASVTGDIGPAGSSVEQLLVTLHRPLPVIFSFFPSRSLGSSSVDLRAAARPPQWPPSFRRLPRR